jgi:hypothetical protein
MSPDGRRPGRDLMNLRPQIIMSPNGRPPTTLPEPIKRARVLGLSGLAGEGNVAEWSERYASVAKPEGHRNQVSRILSYHIPRPERGWACYMQFGCPFTYFLSAPNARRARRRNYAFQKLLGYCFY